MGSGWHWYIAILTVVNILACLWLIVWTTRQGDTTKSDTDTLDHSWDGDLKERNNPLPRWWLYLFVGTIIWGFGYLAWYPGLGAFTGFGGWTQLGQYTAERERVDAIYHKTFADLAALDFDELSRHAEGMDIASRLYGSNCATCHGADARGARGFPNLTDGDWQYGGSAEAVQQTITQGRQGVMPAWGAALGTNGTAEVIAYIRSLAGASIDESLRQAGKTRYDMLCVACHGVDGTGMQALGAPNLADGIWLHGGSDDALAQVINEGRTGVMPAHKELLSAQEIKLLTAYIVSLGQPEPADDGSRQ